MFLFTCRLNVGDGQNGEKDKKITATAISQFKKSTASISVKPVFVVADNTDMVGSKYSGGIALISSEKSEKNSLRGSEKEEFMGMKEKEIDNKFENKYVKPINSSISGSMSAVGGSKGMKGIRETILEDSYSGINSEYDGQQDDLHDNDDDENEGTEEYLGGDLDGNESERDEIEDSGIEINLSHSSPGDFIEKHSKNDLKNNTKNDTKYDAKNSFKVDSKNESKMESKFDSKNESKGRLEVLRNAQMLEDSEDYESDENDNDENEEDGEDSRDDRDRESRDENNELDGEYDRSYEKSDYQDNDDDDRSRSSDNENENGEDENVQYDEPQAKPKFSSFSGKLIKYFRVCCNKKIFFLLLHHTPFCITDAICCIFRIILSILYLIDKSNFFLLFFQCDILL